jgi:Trk-type K+ transport system membrane component
MNRKVVFHIVGMNLTIVGLSMLIPAIWSFYYGTKDIFALLISFLITSGFGLFLFFYYKRHVKKMKSGIKKALRL